MIETDARSYCQVWDVLGRVTQPIYSVRFNAAAEIDKTLFAPGTAIFSVVEKAVPVFVDQLRQQKGSDASNLWDEELPEEVQFSPRWR